MSKIFCIGWHRTGTTSVGDALQQLGYSRLGWNADVANQILPRWHEEHDTLNDLIRQVVDSFDAVEDMPWPLLYRRLDELYPDARFILTRRKDTATWLASIQRHLLALKNRWVGHFLIYGSYDPVGDADKHAAVYERHNVDVSKYFSGARAERFLELCFETGDGWPQLCGFLNHDVPVTPFPHANQHGKAYES